MKTKDINWGIIAPGKIARKFAQALNEVDDAQLYGVASRTPDRAKAFAEEFGAKHVAESYQSLLNEPEIDAIYIASPHSFHAEQSIHCLQAGKAVLCEKPMSVNIQEARKVVDTAQRHGVFFMEALWTRFLPLLQTVVNEIEAGVIGDVKMIDAKFGFALEYDPNHRLYNPELAGGALLDVGIYPITFAQMIQKQLPNGVSAVAGKAPSGVDGVNSMLFKYDDGVLASLSSAVSAETERAAWVFGSKGKIHMPMFWQGEQATIYSEAGERSLSAPHRVNGFEYQIEEANRCLRDGLLESPKLPHRESLRVMGLMDQVRQQIGVRYPADSVNRK